jgi:GT2 family glycosyltransferase
MLGIVCGWEFETGGALETRMPTSGSTLADFASGCWYCPGSTLMLAKQAFDIVGPFDTTLRRLEDFEWFLRFSRAGGRIVSAPVIGAFIAIGRRAGYRNVRQASAKILKDYSTRGHSPLPIPIQRRLRAWLHVEQAAAARNDGRYITMAYHVAASVILLPRRRIALKDWFATGDFERA